MPYIFFEIERQKNWIIAFLFAFLIAFYFIFFAGSWIIIKNTQTISHFFYPTHLGNNAPPAALLTSQEALIISMLAIFIGIFHWSVSQYRVIDKMLVMLGAGSLDNSDKYHQQFQNIIDEVSVASGGIKFEPCIIPTSALNAFSLADFSGRKVIGITEGLIGKLNRRQLESIVGHEVAHIVSGDCLSSTVSCSLFEFYNAILEAGEAAASKTNVDEKGFWPFVLGLPVAVAIYVLLRACNSASFMLNILISREREYRADAIAVRLTRDPLSLAESLYIISRGWKGEGLQGGALSTIFIVNPKTNPLDENEGLFSDMFATHPPTKNRITKLLGATGKNLQAVKDLLDTKTRGPKIIPEISPSTPREIMWMALNPNQQWEGPFNLSGLIGLEWFKADTWIRNSSDETAKIAYEDVNIKPHFDSLGGESSHYSCPDCYHATEELNYEGVNAWLCHMCKGHLLKRQDLIKILLRAEKGFSEDIKRKAELILKDNKYPLKNEELKKAPLLNCPGCNKKMKRLFFSWKLDAGLSDGEKFSGYTFPIHLPIDKCPWCDLYWLTKNKLEILQYMYEKFQSESD